MNVKRKPYKQPFSEVKELAKAAGYHDWKKIIEIQEKTRIEGGEEYVNNYLNSLAYYNLKDYEKAIVYGQKALIKEGKNNFDLFKLLTNICYSQQNHIKAVQYAEQAIQNPKLSPIDTSVINILRFFRLISFIPIFKKFVNKLGEEVQTATEHEDSWIDWAKNYIQWYSQNKEKFDSEIS